MSKEVFNEVLNTIEDDGIREFAKKLIDSFDPYIFLVPSSSTGKYHPSYALGDGGLIRHTVAVVRFLNYLFSIESIANQFTARERDLLRVAAIAHDSKKSGNQEDYESSKFTKFDHPLRAAKFVETIKDDYVTSKDKEFIAHAVESHMGQWNTDKRLNTVLPKPTDKYQIILHTADYLASRKDIEMKFDGVPTEAMPVPKQEPLPDIKTWKMYFGKYKDKTLDEIAEIEPTYITWMKENVYSEPARTMALKYELKEK